MTNVVQITVRSGNELLPWHALWLSDITMRWSLCFSVWFLMVTRHNHRVSAVYLPSPFCQCLISELLPAAPQYLVSSSETDLSPLCSPDSSVAESELAWRHIHGCINSKSIRDVSTLKATFWVLFILCTNAYLIDFGVLFLAWLSNSTAAIK